MTEQQPDRSRREYAVGLPVLVTITDEGFVSVNVDLSELGTVVHKDSTAGPLGEGWDNLDTHTIAVEDSEVLDRWAQIHQVSNEGFAPAEISWRSHFEALFRAVAACEPPEGTQLDGVLTEFQSTYDETQESQP